MEKLIIIGSGPSGLTAAIYASRANLSPFVIAGVTWGGQLMNTTVIENFPGFIDGIDGPVLMNNMVKQAEKFGTRFVYENATQIDQVEVNGKKHFIVKTYENSYEAESVIIATGAIPRKIGVPGEDKFYGHGVSTCATCDGAFYRNKTVAVIGGGDSAMEDANFLTRFATKVFLIHRRDAFRASHIMVDRTLKNEKIEIIYNTVITEIIGEQKVTGIKTSNTITNEGKEINVDGVFLAIGYIPVTDFLKNEIELDEKGYIKSKGNSTTSVEGLFVAGDVEDSIYRQAITASGDGCKAALEVQRWLIDKED